MVESRQGAMVENGRVAGASSYAEELVLLLAQVQLPLSTLAVAGFHRTSACSSVRQT